MENSQHVVCIKSSAVEGGDKTFIDYQLSTRDIVLCQRETAEQDMDYLKVIPTAIVMHEGNLLTFSRDGGVTSSIAIGNDWEINDLIITGNAIDLHESLETYFSNQLEQQLRMDGYVIGLDVLPKILCADQNNGSPYIRHVHIYHVDGPDISFTNDKFKNLGFITPEELTSPHFICDETTKKICEAVIQGRHTLS